MAEGRATYKIDVDARGAQASLDGVVKGALPKFEKLSGSINAAAGQIGGLGGVVGKTLGTFKQFGEAFMVGGPIGVGLAAGVVGVGYLIDKFGEGERAVQKFRDANREAMSDFLGDVEQAAADAEERLAAFGKTADRMRAERASMLVFSAVEVGDDAAARRKELMKDEEKLALMAGISHADRMKMSREDQQRFHAELKALKGGQEARVAYIDGLKETEKNANRAASAHIRERDALNELVNKQDEKARKDKLGKPKEHSVSAEIVSAQGIGNDGLTMSERDAIDTADRQVRAEKHSRMLAAIAANERQWAEDTRAYETAVINATTEYELKQEEDKQKKIADLAKKTAKEKADAEKEALKSVSDAHRAHFQQYEDLAVSSMIAVSGMFFDALEQMAAGQKVMLDVQIARFIRSVGEQMIAIGIRGLAEAAIISLNPMTPGAGGPMAAASVLAIAGGAAMATGGAVAAGMFTRQASGGGGGGGGGSGSSTMRPSRRNEGSSGDDGGRSVTIVYNGGTFLGDSRQHERDRRRHMSNVFVPGVA